ncbi:MAG: hypothetical protein KDC49_15495 [Saprospiraceae bacterium]|nr:hypothetical protein [Saprospiraceae bacterium]
MIKNILGVLLFLLASSPLVSQSQVIWSKQKQGLQILNQVSVAKDNGHIITIDDAIKAFENGEFTINNNKIFNEALDPGYYWFKFDITNTTEDDLVLEISQAILPEAILYARLPDGSWQSISNGYKKRWQDKGIKNQFQDFHLCKTCTSFYLKANTTMLPIDMKLWSRDSFENKTLINRIVFGGILGFMFFVIIYNLFLFFTIRRLEYFLYTVLILGYLSFTLTVSGYLIYLLPQPDLWNWFIYVPIMLQPLGLYYCMVFLEVDKHPSIKKWSTYLLYYLIAYCFINFFFGRPFVQTVNQLNAVIGMTAMIAIGYQVGRRGNKMGDYFALAYVMMLLFGILDICYIRYGTPQYLFDIGYIVIAFLLEVIILSYLLTKRLDWENKAAILSKEEAQQKLVTKTLENERIVKDQNILLEKEVNQRTAELKQSLEDLKQTQAQLIQSEKMASLGELTAGIAHEIQNPLNFVNNFSEVSTELIDEMSEYLDKGDLTGVRELTHDLTQNLQKINHHGKRAGDIVKSMLQHSRAHSGQKELTDLNALADEYLRLAYHGLRAKDKSFNAGLETDFDPNIPKIEIIPQEMGRVLLNLITNAFHAVNERSKTGEVGYKPFVWVGTRLVANEIELFVKDNGTGIPDQIRDKILQPFFTTKPTGQGTGLGLSLAYDIITKGHNGQLKIDTKIGEGTSFIINLKI